MEENRKISSLKEGEDNVNVKVRVIHVEEPKIINTRKGAKRISEAIVGDETGRIKLTLWGKHAGTLREGDAVEIRGAWTTSYRGDVQLNVGFRGDIERISSEEVPNPDEIPEETPKASNKWSARRGSTWNTTRASRSYGQRRGSWRYKDSQR